MLAPVRDRSLKLGDHVAGLSQVVVTLRQQQVPHHRRARRRHLDRAETLGQRREIDPALVSHATQVAGRHHLALAQVRQRLVVP